MARIAEVLGKTADAAKYNDLFEKIRAAFNRAYVAPDGRIEGDTQTDYVLALSFDLLDSDKAKLAAQYLVENIEKRKWHLSTGFIGTKSLMLALAADWPQRRGRAVDPQRHVSVVGIFHQARRDQHLGALGRLDAGERLSGSGNEFLRALFLWRGLSMDGGKPRRHPERRAGLQTHRHRAAVGRPL